jgi:hypothetical protein
LKKAQSTVFYSPYIQKFILQTPAASTPRGRPRKNVDKGTPATTVSKASEEDSSITEVTEENDENRKVVRFFIWKCDEIMIIL